MQKKKKPSKIYSVIDQFLYAASLYCINIFQAKQLSAVDYGWFSILYALVALCSAPQTALITEPLLRFGQKEFKLHHQSYFKQLLRMNAIAHGGLFLLLIVIAIGAHLLGKEKLSWGIILLALTCPFSNMIWLTRRWFVMTLNTKWAAITSFIFCFCFISIFFTLSSVVSARFEMFFVALALAGVMQFVFLFNKIRSINSGDEISFSNVFRHHIDYARYASINLPLTWLIVNIHFMTLGWLSPPEHSALFRYVYNFLTPALQLWSALGVMLLPAIVRLNSKRNYIMTLSQYFVFVISCLSAYFVFVLIFRSELSGFLTGGRYEIPMLVLVAIMGCAIVESASGFIQVGLLSLDYKMRTIKAKAVIVLFVVPLSVVAVQNWGYRGAIFALVSASGISLVVNMFYFSSALRSKKF